MGDGSGTRCTRSALALKIARHSDPQLAKCGHEAAPSRPAFHKEGASVVSIKRCLLTVLLIAVVLFLLLNGQVGSHNGLDKRRQVTGQSPYSMPLVYTGLIGVSASIRGWAGEVAHITTTANQCVSHFSISRICKHTMAPWL